MTRSADARLRAIVKIGISIGGEKFALGKEIPAEGDDRNLLNLVVRLRLLSTDPESQR